MTLSIEDLLRWDFSLIEDETGDEWKKTHYHFSICWSSFSSCTYDKAQEYISFMTEILAFAKTLNDKFTEPCYRLVRTKAHREFCIAEAEKCSDQRAVQVAFDSDGADAIKAMRVGTPPRLFKTKLDATISIGTYVVQGHKKTYEVKNSVIDSEGKSLCEVTRLT